MNRQAWGIEPRFTLAKHLAYLTVPQRNIGAARRDRTGGSGLCARQNPPDFAGYARQIFDLPSLVALARSLLKQPSSPPERRIKRQFFASRSALGLAPVLSHPRTVRRGSPSCHSFYRSVFRPAGYGGERPRVALAHTVFPGCHRLPLNAAHNRKHGSRLYCTCFCAQRTVSTGRTPIKNAGFSSRPPRPEGRRGYGAQISDFSAPSRACALPSSRPPRPGGRHEYARWFPDE